MPQVVLYQPEIPPNTGNIARTCAATETPLHLIEPLGFELSDRYLKRAGLDYWPYVQLTTHPDWSAFRQQQQQQGGRLIAFTTKGDLNYLDFEFQENDWLLYGRETSGLPDDVMASCDVWVRIPITQPGVRSLNLSVSVAIGVFEARRQLYYAGR
ncbi:tRNA (uridine(34)/cytosine(34)/5-carboxymethylaminomethyluridine(34)-2'-O)-methyltransferase TrmL [Synechococcus elongatus]|uniref:Putative tRNA (cytidine(34)-2'-O)-methyltransferase n=1 Tax=Synechococcus elongatus PCC 11802 TaxID=2283154 RepID=A0AAT9JUV6_SYNEL|nr:tRNA (uridine(34)/cytosine(34)/5-carboxymethylaminomethyluridine(34)-2'-O)-methyltransferase TrmL [Synechococcus elongatus]QFZ92863.1 tRNA (uridine(34)/cytosine(34)/5-carboxymethylaminomethyluridine(34)-2'-O)-methyltransferase TrmL [Synechococcus elongatus PCC 11802]